MKLLVTDHKYVPDEEHAVADIVKAGIGQFLDDYQEGAAAALASGLLTEAEIDAVLVGNFRVIVRLGLLDPPEQVPYSQIGLNDAPEPWLSPAHQDLARRVTQKSVVLLRNEGGLLPLDPAGVKSVAVLGARADTVLLDWYSGDPPYAVSPVCRVGLGTRRRSPMLTAATSRQPWRWREMLRLRSSVSATIRLAMPAGPKSRSPNTAKRRWTGNLLIWKTKPFEDLQGINYNENIYDGFHVSHPQLPIFISEVGSDVGTRGVYAEDRVNAHVSEYFNHSPFANVSTEASWNAIASRPYVAGGFLWTGFDYKGEPTPYGWPDVNSHFGALDEAGFPKENYFFYQSVWKNTPMVHLMPHWNWAGQEGKPVEVWCHTNAPSVELFLNGTSLGTKPRPADGSHLTWSVPYAPGTLTAKGYSPNGQVIATDTVETTGAPAALKLTTARVALTADGEDVTMVDVAVVDAQGRVVPTADNLVTFQVSGAAHVAGVGNGDPSSHEPDRASTRHAFGGLALAVVQAGETPGSATLTATAQGLSGATLALKTAP